MTNTELILNMLAKASAKDISAATHPEKVATFIKTRIPLLTNKKNPCHKDYEDL